MDPSNRFITASCSEPSNVSELCERGEICGCHFDDGKSGLHNERMITVFQILILALFSNYKVGSSFATTKCCDEDVHLFRCVGLSSENSHRMDSSIALVTYATRNILDYASFSFAINSVFAQYQGYAFHIMTPESGSEYEPRDQRWNRVKIIADGFSPQGILKDYDYVVWIDADLIFLDLNRSIEDVINHYDRKRNFDVLISSERHAASGVANTGCFIIKNSAWSRNFLNEWWNSFDRRQNHDQVFFDKLYKSKLPKVKDHILILPTEILNSFPPPMLHQRANHKVLHMMGQSAALRRQVFSAAWDHICNVLAPIDGDNDFIDDDQDYSPSKGQSTGPSSSVWGGIAALEPQLGLNQSRLHAMTLTLLQSSIASAIAQIPTIDNNKLALDKISDTREKLLLMKSMLTTHPLGAKYAPSIHSHHQALYLTTTDLRAAFKSRQQKPEQEQAPGLNYEVYVNMVNLCAILGNDYISETDLLDVKRDVGRRVGMDLSELEELVEGPSQLVVREMIGLHHLSTGAVEGAAGDQGDPLGAERSLQKSVEVLEATVRDGGNPYHLIQPYMSLGGHLCSRGRNAEGLKALETLVELFAKLLYAEEQMKEDHIHLAHAHMQAGWCIVQGWEKGQGAVGGGWRGAEKHYQQATALFRAHPERDVVRQFDEAMTALGNALMTRKVAFHQHDPTWRSSTSSALTSSSAENGENVGAVATKGTLKLTTCRGASDNYDNDDDGDALRTSVERCAPGETQGARSATCNVGVPLPVGQSSSHSRSAVVDDRTTQPSPRAGVAKGAVETKVIWRRKKKTRS